MRAKTLSKCPHCGGVGGYFYNDRDVILQKSGAWGNESDQCEYLHKGPGPIWAKCVECGKRVRVKDARGF